MVVEVQVPPASWVTETVRTPLVEVPMTQKVDGGHRDDGEGAHDVRRRRAPGGNRQEVAAGGQQGPEVQVMPESALR